MTDRKQGEKTNAKDVAAFSKALSKTEITKPLNDKERKERKDGGGSNPLVRILHYKTDDVAEASLEQLNEQMRDFRKVILLIEDESHFSEACNKVLHELGYDGVQLITRVKAAGEHLDDIVHNLTDPPAAIVLDLGLGHESGFEVLRKCHAQPKLKKVPILVWTKHSDDLAKKFCAYLGAEDLVVKSDDDRELRGALKKLLA